VVQYNPKIVDHFMNPRNVGEIPDADGVGTVGHPSCGDIVRIYIKVQEKEGKKVIAKVRFKTFGCTTAVATSSIATEMILGKTVDEVLAIKNEDVAKELGGLPPIKMHCSVLAEDAIRAAMADYYKKQGKQDQIVEQVAQENQAHEEKELLSRQPGK
jgi:nitrogen fixation protein NifU and related proteins